MRTHYNIITAFCLALLLSTSIINRAAAGNTWLTLGLSGDISASGLAPAINPSLGLNCRRNSFALGAAFQEKRMNFSGARFTYRYALAENPSGRLQLFFYGNLLYRTSAYLSERSIDVEKMTSPEKNQDFGSLEFRTVECYSGFGIKIAHGQRLSTAFSIGGGFYTTLNADTSPFMYRSARGGGLQLKLMVLYDLTRHKPKLFPVQEQ